MDFHAKLNCFSKYLSEKFYVFNNDLKKSPIDGTHLTDFEPLKIEDLIFNIPNDAYMGVVFMGTGEDGKFTIQMIYQEYSAMRSDYEIEMDAGSRFSGILEEIKSLLTGDDVIVNYDISPDYNVYRDNFGQNSKVRTIFTQEYDVTFS